MSKNIVAMFPYPSLYFSSFRCCVSIRNAPDITGNCVREHSAIFRSAIRTECTLSHVAPGNKILQRIAHALLTTTLAKPSFCTLHPSKSVVSLMDRLYRHYACTVQNWASLNRDCRESYVSETTGCTMIKRYPRFLVRLFLSLPAEWKTVKSN